MTKRESENFNCETCKDEGWVCEIHQDKAWNGGNSECCGAPGMPCKCNTANPPWYFGRKYDDEVMQ